MASTLSRLVVFVGALGLAGAASAQDRLFVSGGVRTMPYSEEITSGTPFGESLGPRSPLVHQPLIAGGRYVPNRLDYCDITPCVVVDWQGIGHPLPYAFVSIVATDPVRPRVFVQTAAGAVDAVDVDTGVVTPMFPAAASMSGSCRYAFSAARLFCVEAAATATLRVFSTAGDGETPQLAGTVASVAYGSPLWLVTPDGARIFSGENATAPARLTLTYVATGARVSVDLPAVWELAWDDFHERLIVVPVLQVGHAFTKDLGYLGSASFPFMITALTVSAATGRLYARGLDGQSAGYGDAYTAAFDGGTYAMLTPVVHTQGFGGPPRIRVLSPPGAPRDVLAAIQGRDVTVTWTNVGGASDFLLDVGLAPGQTVVTVPVRALTRAAFAAVPAGTYYVRIRGTNVFGTSRPSPDIRVVVP
jgi:hypothetical protein